MRPPLGQISYLDSLIRQLSKIDSKLQAGQFIAVFRENRRVLALLEKERLELKKEIENKEKQNA